MEAVVEIVQSTPSDLPDLAPQTRINDVGTLSRSPGTSGCNRPSPLGQGTAGHRMSRIVGTSSVSNSCKKQINHVKSNN